MTITKPAPPDNRLDGPIHTWFSLSYSSHLVVDPALTQLLPAEQRAELKTMLDQLNHSFPDVNRAGDVTIALAAHVYECGDLDEEQLRAIDMGTNDDLGDHSECDHDKNDEDAVWACERDKTRWYDWRGEEYDRHETVAVPTETEAQARTADRTVVSRTLLQSMPAGWQERFVALLERLDGLNADSTPETYDIRFYTADGHRTTDPIPHYNRGRTYIEPRIEG